jgi:hypothetical protein
MHGTDSYVASYVASHDRDRSAELKQQTCINSKSICRIAF